MKIAIFLISILSTSILACEQWSKAWQIGQLNPKIIKESSGLGWSKNYPDILFNINDSGDGTNVYITKLNGEFQKKIHIKSFFSWDSEDIAIGPCPLNDEQCFFYGDIGDGRYFGAKIKIGIIPLTRLFESKPKFSNKTKVILEGGNDDLEGMAVHPNGDLYLASKDHGHTNIFKIRRSDLVKKQVFATIVATLDHTKLGNNLDKSLTTAMDISPDGKKILILTYENIIEVTFDLSTIPAGSKTQLETFSKIIQAPVLPQQEAITYVGAKSIIYSTEADGSFNPLMALNCKE